MHATSLLGFGYDDVVHQFEKRCNSLGVRSQESGRKKEEETPSRRRKFFGRVKVTEFYRALIRT
ncbi:hypothetical protein [Okeania sp. SIO3B5]|uniref:hypothetical protein n=1 Tax=Okeania sp. SIO3B5 TaxID=2607811 RepID=UPI0025F1AE29|nr:hypothetical protein [Okeania sp. SIO3B5]